MRQLLDQRRALLASEDASLAMLRQLDRRILTMVEQGHDGVPLRDFSDGALQALRALPFEEAVFWFEVTATLSAQDPRPAASRLLERPESAGLGWWLAAHYSAVPVDAAFPEAPADAARAAYAFWRRGQAGALPQPWKHWAEVLSGTREPDEGLLGALWQSLPGAVASNGDQADQCAGWKTWYYPMLTRVPDDWQLWMVNWLSARLDTAGTVEAMGVSGARRFLGWLEAIVAGSAPDDELAKAASRELRWLRGENVVDPDAGVPSDGPHEGQPHWWGRQVWGGGTTDQHWQQLSRSLPLGFRERCWYWRGWNYDGGPCSLFGGQWCAGN